MARPKVLRSMALLVAAVCGMAQAQTFTVANNPIFLPSLMAPNIVLTLDDSGSMTWAYVPDSLSTTTGTRRFKSSAFNPLYYNPAAEYPAPFDVDGNPLTSSFTNAPINGFTDGVTGPSSRGYVNLSTQYRPTSAYDPSSSNNASNPANTGQTFAAHANVTADLDALHTELDARTGTASTTFGTTTPGPAYYYKFNASNASCDGTVDDEDCYTLVIVSATSGTNPAIGPDERQNFANWYSFYRTRNLLTASAASRAMVAVPTSLRVAWQSLNTCNAFNSSCSGWASSNFENRIRTFQGTHRQNFYKWLFRLPANNGTPLRSAAGRAGAYFTTSGVTSPYAADPQVTASPEYSCRPNFHIMMTDGIWNTDSDFGSYCSGSSCGNKDGANRTLPDGKSYSNTSALTQIYRDSNSNSISDITFHYWATDLRSDLANNLIPYTIDQSDPLPSVTAAPADKQYWNPKNDPATWQHLVTFTVGLGLTRSMSLTSPDRRWAGSTYAGAGYQTFLTGGASWPTTGTDTDPGNVYDLWHAAINSRGQAFAAESPQDLSNALNAALYRIMGRDGAAAALSTNSTKISSDTLLFQALFNSADWTGKLRAYRINTDGSLGTQVWEATDAGKIPAHASRNIYTWSGTAGIGFTQADLTTASMWSPIGDVNLLNYLRGDQSNEQKNGGLYRNRATRLGDIINSDPAFVGAEYYDGLSALPEGTYLSGTPYKTFVDSKKTRRKMLYVGSNDGLFHGFDAGTGEERFAYVPQEVIPNMAQLSQVDYAHRYFVDGSPVTADAYIGGGWKSVVVGTSGAGGKAVFALDVTDPDAFAANKILWEVNDSTPMLTGDAADPTYSTSLGLTLGQAAVAKMNNGEWAAIFGNGYRSTNERGVLYVVRLSDGRLIKKIDTGVGSSTNPNGLGTPTLYDANGDGVCDYVYITDMRGNVWKFDLSSTSTASWGIAFAASTGFANGSPLFQARSAGGTVQPIEARVELVRPPTGVNGLIVLFGTGRFFASGDNTTTTGQSFYGILDNGTRVTTTDRSELRSQTISLTSINFRGVTTDVRTVSTNTVDWTTKRGWYMDLPTSGERVIGAALVRAGRVIFNTVIPSFDPCTFGGAGWLMEVDAKTGGQLPYSVFDTNGDGLVNDNDQVVSGVPIGVGIVKQPLAIDGSPTALKLMSGTSGSIQTERNRSFGAALGRDSWREVIR